MSCTSYLRDKKAHTLIFWFFNFRKGMNRSVRQKNNYYFDNEFQQRKYHYNEDPLGERMKKKKLNSTKV